MKLSIRFFRNWYVALWLFAFIPGTLLAQTHLDESFKGSYRKKPKTSIVRNKTTKEISTPLSYSTLGDLLGSLTPDVKMRKKYPDLKIHAGDPEKRKSEELFNVEVNCWIHAVKYEGGNGDRDFHVIVGDDPDVEVATFLNVEVTGLPKSGINRKPLKDARKQFLDLFPDKNFSTSFTQIDPPLKVKITGSLFFAGEHNHSCEKCPGPSYAKPGTVWEIHPIYFVIPIP
jgi:hypothetical protein